MPFKTIRLTCAALVLMLALGCLALPCMAQTREKRPPGLPFVYSVEHPNKTALELMQMGMERARQKELDARIRAGEKIEYGRLKVSSQPDGAGVLVDSYVPLGKTPYANNKLLPGPHRVTVRQEGYYEQVRMVEIKANQLSSMAFKLRPIPYARLVVKMRPLSTKVRILYIDKPYTPSMSLPPGDYLVSLQHPFYGDQRLYIVLKDNEDLVLNGNLATYYENVKVESDPPGATVYLDGREVGRTPYYDQLNKLVPGPHLVQVWKSRFKPVSKQVQIKRFETATVKVDLDPVEYFRNNAGMEFVKIPAGRFMMGFYGSPESLAELIFKGNVYLRRRGFHVHEALFRKYPRHLVEISKPFFMQTSELTNAQWDKVMGTVSREDEGSFPKNSVDLNEINKFIAKLNQLDKGKYRYRLPSEAEWEYAARAGTKGLFYTGDYLTTEQANFIGDAFSPLSLYYGKNNGSRVVPNKFSPNPWGLFNMYGNVSELCADKFDGFYYSCCPIKDPLNTGKKTDYYVSRGGLTSGGWRDCMVRIPQYKYTKINVFGFRLVAEKVSGNK